MNHNRTTYMKRRCRCDVCCAAAREYSQIRRGTFGGPVRGEGHPPQAPGGWVENAACRNRGAEFELDPSSLRRHEQRVTAKAERAKMICRGCPCLDACRQWSLTDPDPAFEMIAGGLDPIERAAIRRGQRRSA